MKFGFCLIKEHRDACGTHKIISYEFIKIDLPKAFRFLIFFLQKKIVHFTIVK